MLIFYKCPECGSEIYKEEKEFYVCQQCEHKIPITEIKLVSPDELFVKEKKKRPLYYQLISRGISGFVLGLLYVLSVVIFEYVKYGQFVPFDGYWVISFIFIVGLISIGVGILGFLIGCCLKIYAKRKS